MKKKVLLILVTLISVFYSCTEEDVTPVHYKFVGSVIDITSKEALSYIPVIVTDGSNIHTTTTTNTEGKFELIINIDEINSAYYILIGDETCEKKKIIIHGFANEATDLGIIEIAGPSIPIVISEKYYLGPSEGHEYYKIEDNTLFVKASISSSGRLEIDDKGFCIGKNAQPTINDIKISRGSGLDPYEAKISLVDLDASTTYYIRPYATNSKGTGYGTEFTYTTESGLPNVGSGHYRYSGYTLTMLFDEHFYDSDIEATSVTMHGYLFDNGGFDIIELGFCWDQNGNPSVDTDKKYIVSNEVGTYHITIQNLSPNTHYYYRAYAKNKNGVVYGELGEFTTKDGSPTVETSQVKIGTTLIECYGNVIKDGGFSILRRGFCYNTHSKPTLDDKFVECNSNDIGEYCISIYNLEGGTTYYVRAFAENSQGISYGEEVAKTTLVTVRFKVVDTNNKAIPNAKLHFLASNTYDCDDNGEVNLTTYVGTLETFWATADGYEKSEHFREKPVNKNNNEYIIVLRRTQN